MASRLDRMNRAEIEKIKKSVLSGEYLQKPATPSAGSSRRERLKSTVSTQKQRVVDQSFLNRQNLNEQRLSGAQPDIVRPAETAPAQAMQQRRLEQGGPVPSAQPEFLKPQPRPGTFGAIQQFERDTPIVETPEPKAKGKGVAVAISESLGGLLDTLTFGAAKPLTEKFQRYIAEENAATAVPKSRLERIKSRKGEEVGELLGYIAPGAAIERGVAKLGSKALQNVPKLGRSAITGATAGAIESAAQEGGDVAFRGREFDPENVLLGAGAGGTLGAALPAAGQAIKRGVQALSKDGDSWFNRLFGQSNLGIRAGSDASRTGSGSQIVDNPLKNDAQGFRNQLNETGRAFIQNYVDATAPLRHLGGDIQDIALDARRANNLANTWVSDKAVTPEGAVIGSSLKDIIGSVPRGQGDAFEDYLIVRHAKTRVGRGEKVYEDRLGLNDVDKLVARQAELEARYPQFKQLGEEWDKYNDQLLGEGVNFGLISEAQKAAMREANPNYASMRRQFSKSEKYSTAIGQKQGFSGQKAPIKEVSPTGSARKIVSPIRSAIEQTGAWMNAGLRNRVMQELVKEVRANPKAFEGLVEFVPETQALKASSLKEINDALADGGLDGLADLLDGEFTAAFNKGKIAGGKTDNVVTAMVDGQPIKLRVLNPEVFKALQGVTPQEVGVIMGTFRALSNATKKGATGALAPLFAAKGLSTDVVQSLIQAKNPLSHAGNLVHAVVSSLADIFPQGTPGLENIRGLARDYKRIGGEYSAALRGDRALNRSVGQLKREPLLSPKGVAKGVVGAVKAPFRALEGVSDIAENVNRIAAFRSELNRLGGARTPENIRRAARESQEITTNFSRKGAKSEDIESFIPYSNAAVQGVRRFAKAWQKNPIKTTAAATTLAIMPKIWEQSQFGDDEDYLKLPERTKYRNLIVAKNPDGTFVQIPMPPEYAAIGAFAAGVLNKLQNDEPIKWRDTSDAILNAYTPPFISGAAQGATQGGGFDQSVFGALGSTVAGPISGYVGNQTFTGAPLVPERLKDNSPYMQKDERTSSLSSWLSGTDVGKALKLSPIKVDYLLKQYGGDLARLGLPQLSAAGSGTRAQTLLRNFIVDPTFTNNLSRDFYNKVDRVTQIATDVGDGAEAPSWLTDEVKKLATSRAAGTPLKQLSELSTEKRSILGNTSISAAEKSQKLRENQRKINQIYLDVTSQLDRLGVE